ncbi:uncharacterized protein FPRO_04794 [Fusarium proliferatum ET1]|uniref:Uncharacterized protein n=1 Tax=Fusarium proliferatum (strain ET1) TaxID=1227346 RepID=A0A1L7VJD2_FUSPR|nr:uncharacterized protein FPRO_04794 [Fusarium proliferatum ET1]CVL10081.1 uncharacterized protein FPRN_04651 [Fusarium proliferatum]CZR39896.1 uncharacterized protein FPRO_04794 [Fusarium proliferatum ET1]
MNEGSMVSSVIIVIMRPDLIASFALSADTRLWLWDRNGNLNAAGQTHHSHVGTRRRSRSQLSRLTALQWIHLASDACIASVLQIREIASIALYYSDKVEASDFIDEYSGVLSHRTMR